MWDTRWLVIAGLWGALAVALGAYGAHGLRQVAAGWPEESRQKRLDNWETATRYHITHALALAIAAFLARHTPWGHVAAGGLLLGNLLFSGCLYAYAWWGASQWAMPVPIGGVLQLLGWICMSVAALSGRSPSMP